MVMMNDAYDDEIESLIRQMNLEEKAHELGNDAPANARLGIPHMSHGEILHGVMWQPNKAEADPERYGDAAPTIFPQAIAMGCSFDPDLIERIGGVIAREARALDRHHCYSPCLDIACDSRFGRVEETFGEDPHLVTRLGVAIIHGFQGRGAERFDARHVLATAKHFVGYGEVRGGINGASIDIGERALRDVHLPPFEAAVREAGVAAIMPSHHAQEGVPCHANHWLLQRVLREEWGFEGLVVSDNIDIHRLHGMQRIAADHDEAAILALRAGLDLELELGRREDFMCYRRLPALVAQGRIAEAEIDTALRRVLRAKRQLRLFDRQEREDPKRICACPEHRQLAREAARASQVLLSNDGLLPLDAEARARIALIGPHADRCEYGGYTGKLTAAGITPLMGLRQRLSDHGRLRCEVGCGFGLEDEEIAPDAWQRALQAARESDVVILALGGCRQTCGEGRDNADIRLPGDQEALAHAILDLGKPTVLLLIGGRPWAVAELIARSQACLLAWYGGCEAGAAIAETLFGDVNPGGKLCMSLPKSIGHTQCSYLRRPFFTGAGWGSYRQHDNQPLFAFGHGLSYTRFAYGEIRLSGQAIGPAAGLDVWCTVRNVGERAGDEVVQCYLSDEIASITPFVKQLRAFRRIHLAAGEERELHFRLEPDDLAIWNAQMQCVVEPGWFTVQVGGDSLNGPVARFQVVDPRLGQVPDAPVTAAAISRDQDMEAPE